MILYIVIFGFLYSSYGDKVDDYINLIEIEIKQKNYLVAKDIFNNGLDKGFVNANFYFNGSNIFLKIDDLDNSNKYIIKAIELKPTDDNYRKFQENLLELRNQLSRTNRILEKGDYQEAIDEYNQMLLKFENSAMIYYKLGRAYRLDSQFDNAYNSYIKASSINPFEQNYINSFKKLSSAMIKKGDENYKISDFDNAYEFYNKAIKYSPKYSPAYFRISKVYLKRKELLLAIESIEKGLSYDNSYYKEYYKLGRLYRKNNQIELAKKSISKSIDINQKYTKAYFELGQIYYDEEKFDKAIQSYNKAIRTDSTFKKAYLTIGMSQLNKNNYRLAEQYFNHAINIDNKYIDAYYRLINLYNIEKKYDLAKDIAKKSMYVKQNHPPILFELGLSELSLCNIAASKNAFEKAKRDRSFRKSVDYYLKNISYHTKHCK